MVLNILIKISLSIEEFKLFQYIDKLKIIVSLIHGINIIRISDPTIDNINKCMSLAISLTFDKPFVLFDDKEKYNSIINTFYSMDNSLTLIDEEHRIEFKECVNKLEYYMIDMKTNSIVKY